MFLFWRIINDVQFMGSMMRALHIYIPALRTFNFFLFKPERLLQYILLCILSDTKHKNFWEL